MTVHMPPSLAQFTSQVVRVRCELSLDLMSWGVNVEQSVGPKLWEEHTGVIPSPLRWSFWQGVAMRHEILMPNIDLNSLLYHESLLSVAVGVRLNDNSLERLYRVHHGAKLIYDEFVKKMNSQGEGL